MSLPLLATLFLVLLVAGYHVYGSWVARQFALDDARATPAHVREDGVDYVPTSRFYLFAQHFSAIAAAGPIAGPILACQEFGWLPCLLWIGFGVVFIGAVHDFASLAASVRHDARSVAEIMREHLGPTAGRAMMGFIWIALVYVILAFTDITAGTFVSGTEELEGSGVSFNAGGAVAAASTMYLALSIVMGLVQRRWNPPLWLVTVLFVPATFGVAWLGTHVSHLLIMTPATWAFLILAYCCVASVVPVWALLQPRGYLGGFVLYSALAVGVIGILFGGYEIRQPAVTSWTGAISGSTLFPYLFVTIACGACSGFHGLVCSGTTSKQVARESHMKLIGYGAMLAEAFVALIALVTVMIVAREGLVSPEGKPLAPGRIYGNGIGSFMTLLVGEERRAFAITFGAMAFSTFVFDTLDVCTRLGRYLVQELFGWRSRAGAWAGTLITIALPTLVLALGGSGAWGRFWILFGASNQLLAALTLLAITAWLRRSGRRTAFALVPMVFVLVITIWALVRIAISSSRASHGFDVESVNAFTALTLVLLALFLALTALVRALRDRRRAVAA